MALNNLIKGSFTLALFYIVSKFLSFWVEMLIASRFGACEDTDVYYLTDGIYLALSPMLSIGIWKIFMPEYKSLSVKGYTAEANKLTANLIVVFASISFVISLIMFMAPSLIIEIFAPGFEYDKVKIASKLLKILSLSLFLATLATFPTAILQSRSLFSKSQIKDIVYFIFPILFLLVSSSPKIEYLAVSVLIANVVSCILQFSILNQWRIFNFTKKIFDKRTMEILKLYPIASMNAIILQLNNVIDRIFSSMLVVGSITCLNYGSKIIHLFDGLFSTAISVAVFPRLTELYTTESSRHFGKFISNYVVILSAILFPLSLILVSFSNDIASILFGYGKFDASAINTTSEVLKMYAFGFIAMGLTTITNDVFFITKKVRYLLYTTIINLLCNIILDFCLLDKFGVSGLCLATSISLFLTLLIKWIVIRDLFVFTKSHIIDFSCIVFSLLFSAFIFHGFISDYLIIIFNKIGHLIIGSVILMIIYSILLLSINRNFRTVLMSVIMKK